ncbi:MAG: hypothetical protein R3E89_02610 [Thiolinea sp.]
MNESACVPSTALRDFGMHLERSYGDASHATPTRLFGNLPPDSESGSQYSYNAYGDGDCRSHGAGTWYLSGDEDTVPPAAVYRLHSVVPMVPKMTAMSYSADLL